MLQRVGAEAVPGMIEYSPTLSIRIIADTVTLRADGTGRHKMIMEQHVLPGPVVTRFGTAWDFVYHLDGLVVEAESPPCPVSLDCVAIHQTQTFRLIGRRLTDGASPYAMLYERVADAAGY